MFHLRPHAHTHAQAHTHHMADWLTAHHISRAMLWAIVTTIVAMFLIACIMLAIGLANQLAPLGMGGGAYLWQAVAVFATILAVIVIGGGWFIAQIGVQVIVAAAALPLFLGSLYYLWRTKPRQGPDKMRPSVLAHPAES